MKSVQKLIASTWVSGKALKKSASTLRRTAGMVRTALNGDGDLTAAEQGSLGQAAVLLEKMARVYLDASRQALVREQQRVMRERQVRLLLESKLAESSTILDKVVFVAAASVHDLLRIRDGGDLDFHFSNAKKDFSATVAFEGDDAAEKFQTTWARFEALKPALALKYAELASRLVPA